MARGCVFPAAKYSRAAYCARRKTARERPARPRPWRNETPRSRDRRGRWKAGRAPRRLCDAERRFAVRRAAHCFVRQLDAVRPRRRIWARPISPLRTMVRPRFTAAGTAAADWRSSPAAARALLHRRAYRASCRRSRSKLLVGVEPLQYFVNLADDLSPDVGGSGRASCAVCFSAFCLCRSNSAGASSVPTWLC
jgi:hypothetical protein